MNPRQAAQLAARAGCRVSSTHPLPNGQRAYDVRCRSHRSKVQLLANLAAWDAGALALPGPGGVLEYSPRAPELRDLATRITAGMYSDTDRIAALQAFIQRTVHWIDEPRETFTDAMQTIERGAGDCDDSARALAALFFAAGYRPAMGTLDDPPRHVAAKVYLRGVWYWAEASIPAQLGEEPTAALRRLGAAFDHRKDIAP